VVFLAEEENVAYYWRSFVGAVWGKRVFGKCECAECGAGGGVEDLRFSLKRAGTPKKGNK